jgi:ribosome-associated protein
VLEPETRPEPPSKTRRKREMHALQDLGTALAALAPERLARLALPEALHEAILQVQRITKHEARRRQMQYIGRLMREVDAEPIREALAGLEGRSQGAIARQHRVERLRLRLLEDEGVLAELAAAHPEADMTALRRLRRAALEEQARGKPPRAFREIFRLLRELDAAEAKG